MANRLRTAMHAVLGLPLGWWHRLNSWLERKATLLSAWSSVVAIIGIPVVLLGGFFTWIQVKDYLTRPDIALYLDSPKRLRFRLLNISAVLLREPKYAFNLWDFDARVQGEGEDPGNLRIPTKSLKYIRPNAAIGPWLIDGLSDTAANVPAGHVVFGWVSLQCPDCETRRHYWLLYKKGETAWYSVIPPNEQPAITKNLSSVLNSGAAYPETISQLVSGDRRMRVQDHS